MSRRICFWCDGEEGRTPLHWDLDRESWYHARCARPGARLDPPLKTPDVPVPEAPRWTDETRPDLRDQTWSAIVDQADVAALASLFEEG
jgi:hypothetical protein